MYYKRKGTKQTREDVRSAIGAHTTRCTALRKGMKTPKLEDYMASTLIEGRHKRPQTAEELHAGLLAAFGKARANG